MDYREYPDYKMSDEIGIVHRTSDVLESIRENPTSVEDLIKKIKDAFREFEPNIPPFKPQTPKIPYDRRSTIPYGLIPNGGGPCPRVLLVVSNAYTFHKRLTEALHVTNLCRDKTQIVIFVPFTWSYSMETDLENLMDNFAMNGVLFIGVKFPTCAPLRGRPL
jgi:hypothetical protein